MKKEIRKQWEEHKWVYLCLFLVLFIFTSGFLYNRYATDTYYLEGYGYRNNAFHPYFQDGRLLMTLFLGVMAKLHIPFGLCKIFSCLLAIGSLYASILIFYHILLQVQKKPKYLSAFLSFFVVLNIFIVEFFMFPEYTGVMCFSIFLISMATRMMIQFFKTREKKFIAYACLFSFFTAFCYQGTLSLLVLFPIGFTLYYGKDIKTFLQNNLVIALCYLVPSVTTLVTAKLLGSSRSTSELNLSLAFSKIYDGSKHLLVTTFHILPTYFFIGFVAITSVMVLYLLIRSKEKVVKYLFFIYTMAAVVIVTLVPHFLIKASNVWIVPRSNIGLGLLAVMPFLIYYLYLKKSYVATKWFVFLFVVLSFFQVKGWQGLLFDQIKVNAFDRREAQQVVKQIHEYEKEENMITKVSLYKNKNPQYQYDGTIAQGDMNVRALATDWAASSLISKYLGRELVQIDFDRKMSKICQKRKEQEGDQTIVLFKNDAVYLCSY